ncbi:MAG: 3-hydroxyacyl-CoA dehydrogenase [Fimbriimonadales bacterium]|nr:MAG: 3-hydroxyacyl-CoA dehydrogenase [Fimbriimonadales bacterium]
MRYDSWINTQRVAVLGAGTMGTGIAAHLANLGFDVLLYDVSKEQAAEAIERAKNSRPPHFYTPKSAERITPASITDDLDLIRHAEWVCEAVVEKADVKKALYEQLEQVLPETAMVSTNTSGLEIGMLAEGRSESFRERFMGTHFFNPPRYLKLVELIPTPESLDHFDTAKRFLEDRVGRRVVRALDTPGFISNRYGMWCLYHAIHTADRLGFSVPLTDAISGPLIGRPKTATFRLADLIGLDIMEDIASHLRERCEHDPRRDVLEPPPSVLKLIEKGWIGNKAGQGYYKREGNDFLHLHFRTYEYGPIAPPDVPGLDEWLKLPLGERLRKALESKGEVGEFVRAHIPAALQYAMEVGPEISLRVSDFDNVMKWGWGWEMGPFELADAIGYDALEPHMSAKPMQQVGKFYVDGRDYDFRSQAHETLPKDPRTMAAEELPVVLSGDGFVIRRVADGHFLFQFRTKMNAIDPWLVEGLQKHIESHPGARVTLAGDRRSFSVGFNLTVLLDAAEEGKFQEIEGWIRSLQQVGRLLETVPSIAVAEGFCLGGGMELAMRCSRCLFHPEALVGLPEALVGLIPAGGGTALARLRTQGDLKQMVRAALLLGTGQKVPACAAEGTPFFRDTDALLINPDFLLHTAVNMAPTKPAANEWQPAPPPLAGMIETEIEARRQKGEITEYGAHIAEQVKHVFTKATSEEEALDLEVEGFLKLIGNPLSQNRIKHMLETGKPLNN